MYLLQGIARPGLILLLFLPIGVPGRAADATDSVNIDVRASVDERWEGVHKRGAIEHGKVFGIASIKEVPAGSKLVRPVDETKLVGLLRTELGRRGFTEMGATQKPDIVLTVLYGRGWLRNPYLQDAILNENADGAPTASITSLKQAFRQREPDFEAKMQAAQQEKLFIRISAWKYPEQPGEKPVEYWKTTMVVDDPDHRDLNQLMQEMLAAGSGYFDRIIKEEVRVNRDVPAGKVIFGRTEIIETDPKLK